MAETLTLAWRQYRLERRMFWRNPSAAFFNFLLPLLFLAGGGIILSGSQHDLNRLLPAIAALSVMSTTFTALAYNIVYLRERGVLQRARLPAQHRRGAAAQAADRRALGGDRHGVGPQPQPRRARDHRAVGRLRLLLRRSQLQLGVAVMTP